MATGKRSFSRRVQYWFDNFMSRGVAALTCALVLISLLAVFLVAFVIQLFELAPISEFDGPSGLLRLAWLGFLHAIDQGTIAGTDGSIAFIGALLLITIVGIFSLSLLIGILTNGLSEKLSELKEGRSCVVETDHIVILGWSQQVLTTICELIHGHTKSSKLTIVVLGQCEKTQMYSMIDNRLKAVSKVGDDCEGISLRDRLELQYRIKKARIVCRKGNPADLHDIEIASLESARSIIIVAPDGIEPDMQVVKSLLVIRKKYDGRLRGDCHIVAEFMSEKSRSVAEYFPEKFCTVGAGIQFLHRESLIPRIVAQACRQTGLSDILVEIMGYDGNEIYIHSPGQHKNKEIGEVARLSKNGTVMGLWDTSSHTPILNPALDMKIEDHHLLVSLCKDRPGDLELQMNSSGNINIKASPFLSPDSTKTAEHTLVIGYNSMFCNILEKLDAYVGNASTATLLVDPLIIDANEVEDKVTVLRERLHRLDVKMILGDGTDFSILDKISPTSYNHVILLAYSDHLDFDHADSRTLITLLQLRSMEAKQTNLRNRYYTVVAEMCDSKNRDLVERTGASDFIVSDKLISLLIAQYTQDWRLFEIFRELLGSEGCEVYLKLASLYCDISKPVTVSELIVMAQKRSETFLGYLKIDNRQEGVGTGICLNPTKDEIVQFSNQYDRIVVLSEEG